MAPLADMTKGGKRKDLQWSKEALLAFEKLKVALYKSPLLYIPDFDKTFFLRTDASGVALEVVLSQGITGEEWPITYASQKLLSAETQYSTTERECLAIKWGIELFRYYLMGRKFLLITHPFKMVAAHKD